MSKTDLLNEAQQRRLLANAKHADELLSSIEEILIASESRAAFPKYRPDVSLHQTRLIRSQIARFRSHLSRVLAAVGVAEAGPRFGALHSIRVALTFIRISVQEMAPEYLRGYGDLSGTAIAELRGLSSELLGLLDGMERQLALGEAADLQARLDRLERTTREAELLRLLDRIVGDNELAEFRGPLLSVLEKIESRLFEIAVFGRVSSGKSSLLNHVLHTDVLPVGVNPITAVPTRLVFRAEPQLAVTFSDRQVRHYPVDELAAFASEERNPGNQLGVVRLVAGLPSPRLREGLVLVDTPGLGSLATAGAQETMAYLPQCDLGIVLVSAVNPINDEDLNTIHALTQGGIPAMVLLGKADLLASPDRSKALAYTKEKIFSYLGLRVTVHPISTVGTFEEMLECWFREELEPLYDRHRQLVRESVRRKAGAIRESVVAALRSRLGVQAPPTEASADSLQEIERRLREAAGGIEEQWRVCHSFTDEVRSLGEIALVRAATAVTAGWNEGDSSGIDVAAIARAAIEEVAASAASQISAHLRGVGEEMDSALKVAASTLGGIESEGSLSDCVREMPRFETALPDLARRAPWFRGLIGLTQWWLARELRRKAGTAVEAGFVNYGRSLETWVRRVLAEMRNQFETRADAHRAQLERLINRKTLSAGERARLERDIGALESFEAAEPVASGTVTTGRSAHPSEAAET